MDGPAEELRENPDVKEFYLGLSGDKRKSYRDGRSQEEKTLAELDKEFFQN